MDIEGPGINISFNAKYIIDVLKAIDAENFIFSFNQPLTTASITQRDNKNFVLMILDIDFFKQYNDTYGHDKGDEVLKNISLALKDTLKRASDYIFRLGGEEFAIITSDIQYIGLVRLCNRLLKSVSDLKIEHRSSSINDFVSISIGAKIIKSNSAFSETKFFKLADNALYEAKELGRNKAVIKE